MRRKILALVIVFLVSFRLYCTADIITFSALYDSTSRSIDMHGSGDGIISLIIPQKGSSKDDISDEFTPFYFKSVIAQNNKFSTNFCVPESAEGGKYYVYATDESGNTLTSTVIIPSGIEDENLINTVNSAVSATALEKILSENADAFGIDKEDRLFIESGDKIAETMLSFNLTYKKIFDVTDLYNTSYAIVSLSGASNEQTELILEKYESNLGIDYIKDIKNYNFMFQKSKDTLLSMISETDMPVLISGSEPRTFKTALNTMIFMAEIQNCTTWQDLKELLLNKYPAVADAANSSTYLSVKYKDKVFSIMMSDTLSSPAAVKKSFEE